MMNDEDFRSLSEALEPLLLEAGRRKAKHEEELQQLRQTIQTIEGVKALQEAYTAARKECEELKAEQERLRQEWGEQQQALKQVIEEQKAQFAELNKISQKTMTEEMLEEQLKPIRKYLMQSRNKKPKAKARIHKVVTEMLLGRELPDDFVLLLNSFDVEEEESEPAVEECRPLPPELSTPEARKYWRRLQAAGHMDENCQPTGSRTEMAMVVYHFCQAMGWEPRWTMFEKLWDKRSLHKDYETAMQQAKAGDTIADMKRIFGR